MEPELLLRATGSEVFQAAKGRLVAPRRRKCMRALRGKIALMALAGALTAVPASAATIIDEAAGLVTVTGFNTGTAGTNADPWVVLEDLAGPGMISLTEEQGSAIGPDNPTGSGHSFGKWIAKIIQNTSAVPWTSFELELRVDPSLPSLDGDGLSFAQGSGFENTFISDKFGTYSAIEDIRDYLNFHNGVVMPGESVTFFFAITDNQTKNQFFLLQTPNRREVGQEVPEPATMLLLGAGLVGASARKLRKNRAQK
jgi:hypothetical protein